MTPPLTKHQWYDAGWRRGMLTGAVLGVGLVFVIRLLILFAGGR